jgi:D-lactate dehydrogenase
LIDRISFASDAGFYHLVPKAVVQPRTESEIQALFALSRQEKIPLVFRGGGTSLSGQSITDGILVDLSQHWNRMSVEENGKFVRVQPGVIGSQVNARLKPWKRKIGPDPSSISAAMMGGILSNNSSGMCCGVAQNSYHTTRTIRFILPDGSTFDTGEASHYKRFEQEKPGLANELTQIRNQIQNNPQLHEMIREKYQMKNTVG